MNLRKTVLLLVVFAFVSCSAPTINKHIEKNAITQRSIVEGTKPVLYVLHDTDNQWIFLASENARLEIAEVLTLQQMFDIDASLKALSDLKPGWQAVRSEKGKPWERSKPAYP